MTFIPTKLAADETIDELRTREQRVQGLVRLDLLLDRSELHELLRELVRVERIERVLVLELGRQKKEERIEVLRDRLAVGGCAAAVLPSGADTELPMPFVTASGTGPSPPEMPQIDAGEPGRSVAAALDAKVDAAVLRTHSPGRDLCVRAPRAIAISPVVVAGWPRCRGWSPRAVARGRAAIDRSPPSEGLSPACSKARSRVLASRCSKSQRLDAVHDEVSLHLAVLADVESHIDPSELGRIEADLEAVHAGEGLQADLDRDRAERHLMTGGRRRGMSRCVSDALGRCPCLAQCGLGQDARRHILGLRRQLVCHLGRF